MPARTAPPPGSAKSKKAAKTAPTPREPVSSSPAQPDRLVDGLVVVKVEPVLSGLTGKGGGDVALRFDKLTLEDGSERFDCQDCDHVGGTRGAAQAHRATEHPSPKTQRRQNQAGDVARLAVVALPLAEVVELAVLAREASARIEELQEAVHQARKRAVAAETKTARIKGALARAGFKLEEAE